MSKIPLTKAQRKALKLIKKSDPAIIRRHRKATGTECYRLLDSAMNPVSNIRRGVIDRLINKQRISINGGGVL
jgi:hypothetical protein